MAAIAVLAVAFAVLAALPTIGDGSEGTPIAPATMQTVEKYSPDVRDQYVTDKTVSGDWELAEGEKVTIAGDLIVPEGTAMTVLAGAELIIADTANVEIRGTLAVKEDAKVTQNGGKVSVYGNLKLRNRVGYKSQLDF